MTQKLKAIVIKGNEVKEKDMNILIFSIEQGKIWATLKGVKNPKAKMKTAKNPFTFGEFVLEDGKIGKIVTSFDVIESFHEICEDLDKFFIGSAMLEIVEKMEFSSLSERAAVFMLLVKSLKILCFENGNNLLPKFLIDLFKICGCPIYNEKCSSCGSVANEKMYVNYAVGELVCVACKNAVCEQLPPAVLSALKILSNTALDKISTIKLAAGSEMALLKILVKNFENRFDIRLKMMGILS